MPNFLNNLIQRKIIDPAIKPFVDEIKKKDEVIKIQQDRIESSPQRFSIPGGTIFDLRGTTAPAESWKKVVSFDTLRAFSERYDVARACIDHRKRQIEGVDWTIKPVDPNEKADKYRAQIKAIKDFLKRPNGPQSRFRYFLDKTVEDLLVLDGAAIWKDKTRGGKLLGLVNVDAATIRLRVMEDGSVPESPEPAYEQWIQGKKVADFTTDQMIYFMLNPRSNTPYGFAPLEALILGVDAALKSQLYNLSMLTEGTVPEGFGFLPESWTVAQIKEFQEWFDNMLAGNPRYQQRIKFMPGGKGVGYTATKKPEEMRYLEYEKWLLKKTCAVFKVLPSEIGFTEDVNKATATQQGEVAISVGLRPILQVLNEILDVVVQEDLGYEKLEFDWFGLDKKDELRDAEIARIMIPLGAFSVDEWRQENDKPPIGLDHYIMTPNGPVFLKDLEIASEKTKRGKAGAFSDLIKWKTKATNDFKSKKPFREFISKTIDPVVRKIIRTRLQFCETRDDVRNVFDVFIAQAREQEMLATALNLKENINQTLRDYEKAESVKQGP